MFDFIRKTFIRNYSDTNNEEVRGKYGTVFSIFSIICNIIMVVFKLIVSFITNSVSVRADALNNLSDVGSNIATLFGFKLANKHPDGDHPYGHGRMEYISGLVVSFLILLMGFSALKESFLKILHPEELNSSIVAIIVLVVSIGIKLIMANVNNNAGKAIDSDTLLAAGQDSKNDAIMTTTTLICLLVHAIFNIHIDAYAGFVVSLFVIKSGIEIFKGVLDTILGKAPDKELLNEVEKTVLANKQIHGIHDLMFHDYGHSQQFMTFHAEVDCREDVIKLHDLIDNIEREILEKYNILTTIHMDPVDYKDKEIVTLRNKVKKIVKSINPDYTIHDFRVVKGPTHTNLVFDCLLPAGDRCAHEDITKKIEEAVNKMSGGPYYCVIQVEHSFVD